MNYNNHGREKPAMDVERYLSFESNLSPGPAHEAGRPSVRGRRVLVCPGRWEPLRANRPPNQQKAVRAAQDAVTG